MEVKVGSTVELKDNGAKFKVTDLRYMNYFDLINEVKVSNQWYPYSEFVQIYNILII